MLAFPIIFREVTVAARRKRTFVLRSIVALVLGWMTFQIILGQTLIQGTAIGLALLGSFSGMMFFVALIAAPAMTCGCISDERNEGTLGLLFLTDLNSADIVLGKFVGKGFDSFLLLLSATPFLFVPILLGGVSWGQAAGTVINLMPLLVIALATGVWASTLVRTTSQSWLVAYLFLGSYNLLPTLFRWIGQIHLPLGKWSFTITIPSWLRLISPVNGTLTGDAWSPGNASITLLCCMATAMLLLAWAIGKIPHTYVDMDTGRSSRIWGRASLLSRIPVVQNAFTKNVLLDSNPVAWREAGRVKMSFSNEFAFVMAIVAAIGAYMFHLLVPMSEGVFVAMSVLGWIGILGIKILLIVSTCRTFVTEKQDGSLELLLTTPLTNHDIVDGKLRGIKQRFAPAWVMVFLLLAVGTCGSGSFGDGSIFMVIIALFVVMIAYLDFYCTACICLFVSAKAKTHAQAIVLGVLATVVPLWLCSCFALVIVPIMAIRFQRALVRNLRQYATQ